MIIDAGKLGLSYVDGDYQEEYKYDFLDFIVTGTGCYLSLDYDNLGNPVSDTNKWKCMIDLTQLNSTVSSAEEALRELLERGNYAKEQGDYAKREADKVAEVILKAMRVANHPTYISKEDHHVYEWDDENRQYVDSGITIDVILNYDDMTEEDRQDFADRVGANIGLAREVDIRAIVSEYPKALFDIDGNLIVDQNDDYALIEGEPTTRTNKINMTVERLNELLTGHNSNGVIDTVPEVIDAMSGIREDGAVSGEEDENVIENVFFPPIVTGITADMSAGGITLNATAENIDEDEDVTWVIDMDGTETEIDSMGTALELTAEQVSQYDAASNVSVKLICYDYESDPYTLKSNL